MAFLWFLHLVQVELLDYHHKILAVEVESQRNPFLVQMLEYLSQEELGGVPAEMLLKFSSQVMETGFGNEL